MSAETMTLNHTLLAVHISMTLALIIIAIRLILRARRCVPSHCSRRRYNLDASDILCIASVPFLIARWTLAHIFVTWGTNNIDGGKRVFGPGEIWRRETGSKCVLA